MEYDSDSDTETDILQMAAVVSSSRQKSFCNKQTENDDMKKDGDCGTIAKALILNEKAQKALRELHKKLKKRLEVCKSRRNDVRYLLSLRRGFQENDKNSQFSYYQCGIPYFKDQFLFHAPTNLDVDQMKACDITNYFHGNICSNWTSKQKNFLELEVLKLAREIKKNELNYRIKKLQKEIKNYESSELNDLKVDKKKLVQQLNANFIDLVKIDKMSLASLVSDLGEDFEFDWEFLSLKANVGHTSSECRSLWRVFLHPSINKKPWTVSEEKRLTTLATGMRAQDWNFIAQELGTGRSAYQCFLLYRLQMIRHKKMSHWTLQEDKQLKEVIEKCRMGNFIPWAKVAYYIHDRTKEQIYNHWKYFLNTQRRGRFIPEEDAVIIAATREMGCSFTRIADLIPGRSSSQIRFRYHSLMWHLSKNYSLWSLSEDKLLLNAATQARNDPDGVSYKTLTNFFENKTANSIRMRLQTLENWIQNNPQKPLSRAPRRKTFHSKLQLESKVSLQEALRDMHKILEKPKEKKICIHRREESRYAHRNIHFKFLDYYKKKLLFEQASKNEQFTTPQINISELKNVLLLLGAQLNKNLIDGPFSLKYPDLKIITDELLNSERDMSRPKIQGIKTYSRKKTVDNINNVHTVPKNTPSIWFDSKSKTSRSHKAYVFPPFNNNIMAFKKIMLDKLDINVFLQKQLATLQSYPKFESNSLLWRIRFETLFTWPANLSNIAPGIKTDLFEISEQNKNQPISCKDNFIDDGRLISMNEFLKGDDIYHVIFKTEYLKHIDTTKSMNTKSNQNESNKEIITEITSSSDKNNDIHKNNEVLMQNKEVTKMHIKNIKKVKSKCPVSKRKYKSSETNRSPKKRKINTK